MWAVALKTRRAVGIESTNSGWDGSLVFKPVGFIRGKCAFLGLTKGARANFPKLMCHIC